jgi:hypothetical protein
LYLAMSGMDHDEKISVSGLLCADVRLLRRWKRWRKWRGSRRR